MNLFSSLSKTAPAAKQTADEVDVKQFHLRPTKRLSEDEIREVLIKANYSQADIAKLFGRFKHLEPDSSEKIHSTALLSMPELAFNAAAMLLLRCFIPEDEMLTKHEFVAALAILHPSVPPDVKIDVFFKSFDKDEDELVTASDMFQVMRAILGPAISSDHLQLICDNILQEWPVDGQIPLRRFAKLFYPFELDKKVAFDPSKTLPAK